jgi:hypothetical protein
LPAFRWQAPRTSHGDEKQHQRRRHEDAPTAPALECEIAVRDSVIALAGMTIRRPTERTRTIELEGSLGYI